MSNMNPSQSKIDSESEFSLQNKFRVSFTTESFLLQNRQNDYSNSMMNYYTLDPTKTSTQPSDDSKTDVVAEQTTSSVYYDSVIDLSDLWGSYSYQKFPWQDNKRPYNNIRKVGELDDDEKAGILSKRMIAASLSYLERCPEFELYALCKCVLSGKKLTDVSALRTYHFIQYLDLSLNELTTLKALGKMPFLQHLDVSCNAIENLLDFEPPLYLTFVNYSHNLINEIPDITDFWSIVHLDLSHNKITEIKGLQNLRFLNHLDLSENNIETLSNLSHLRIQTLLLSNNVIREIEEGDNIGLKTMAYLRNINLSNNSIGSLHFFKHNALLTNVKLCNNLIQNLMEIYNFENKRFLVELDLRKNSISTKKHYREVCIRTIPNLRVLDSVIVTNEEHVQPTTNAEDSIDLVARESRLLLLYLEQINRPKIGNHIVPYDQPPPQTFLIIGPPASNRKRIVNEFVKNHRRLVRGISYTTRPPTEKEINDHDYYFVSPKEFQEKLNNGEFISLSEFNGYSYAIAYQELEKASDHHVIVFYCDLMTGLSFKSMGLRPMLVIAIPRSEEIHLKWITESYYCELMDSKYFQIKYGHKKEENITEFIRKVIEENLSLHLEQPVLETPVEENGSVLEDANQDKYPQNSKGGILKKCSKDSIRKKECSVMELSKEEISNSSSNSTDNGKICMIWKNSLVQKKVSWIQSIDIKYSEGEADLNENQCFFANRGDQFPGSLASKDCKSCDTIPDMVSNAFLESEIIKQEQAECMKKFQERVLKMKQDLLDMHWDNPGLFREIIFTEDLEESLNKLTNQLKNIIEYVTVKHNKEWLEDKSFGEMLNKKISRLDLQKRSYLEM